MPRVWLATKRIHAAGFSPVEVLLAASILGFLVVALVGAMVYGRTSTADSGNHARATQLANEGMEAVRNIRDAAYANLSTDSTFGLVQSSSIWNLSGANDTINGFYKREVTISSVDSKRKSVTVKVSWPLDTLAHQVTITSRMTDWASAMTPPPVTTGPIMMAYSKTTTTPFYRIWNGTSWGAEASAQNVVGNINYVVLKSSRTRNEAILGVQTSTGAIYIQIWNGTSWGNLTQVGTGPTTTRSFDIAYEKNTDRAMIIYTPTSGAIDFAYRTWDGTTLTAGTAMNLPPTTGAINWMELRQNPLSTSNELAMIMLDANADVYGMVWFGSAWSTVGNPSVWDASAASATKKTIDVEYEQTSGKAMFMWGDSVATDQYYRTWNGTTLSAATLLDIATEGGLAEWIQLAARPNSNEIMLGVQDAGADLNTRKWSGTAWDTATQHPEHSGTVENITSRVFDIIWETHSSSAGKAWLLWGDSLTVTAKQWSGTAWGTGSVLASSDDTSFIRLRADPVSGTVFAGIYEDSTAATKHIWETRLTGGGTSWSAKNTIWTGPTSATPVFFRIDIATP
jgi:Tfp pilus assembly protein PilV